jgi:predicted phage tail protein
MRIIFYGELRRRYGESFDMVSNTIADAMEGLASQLPDWPRTMRISAVGFDTHDKLIMPTDAKEVHVMPAMAGGGGKFGTIIMGAVTFAVGAAVFFLVPGGQAIGISLMVSGALMMVQGVIQLFMKAPSLSKNNDPDGSKYLAVNRNTTAVGTPITLAWGTIDLAGHWLSLQSDSSNLAFGTFPATPT